MANWYDAYLEAQKKKKKDEKEGKIYFAEASKASRPQTTLPGYQGSSKKKSYQWETDTLRNVRGMGRSYNDKFQNIARRAGMTNAQADDYRRTLDFEEDRKQTIKLNDDGTPNQRQAMRAGQGAHYQSEIIDGIFKNMNQKVTKSFQESKKKELEKAEKQAKVEKKQNEIRSQVQKGLKENSLLDDLLKIGKATVQTNVLKQSPKDVLTSLALDYLKEGKKPNQATKEIARGVTRTANTAGLGLIKELAQKKNDSYYNNQVFNEREGGKKAADVAYDMLGYIAPGEGVYSGLTKLMGKDAVKGLSGKAIRGALAGGLLTGGEVGVSSAVNPEKQNAKQNLEHILLGTAIGGVADPALALAGQGITKGFESAANRTMNKILPDKKEAAKRLSEILKTYHQEQAPLPGKSDVRNVSELLPSGNDITNPNFVSKLKPQTKPEVTVPKYGPSLEEALANPRPDVVPSLTDQQVPKTNETLKEQPLLNQQMAPEQAPLVAPKQSKTIAQPIALKTIKTKKDVNIMSKDELQSIYKQLRKEHKNLSKAKGSVSEQRLKEVQNDMEQVQGLLMRLDLQLFGEGAPIADLPDTRVHIGSKTNKGKINVKAAVDKAYIKTVDNLHYLDQFDKTVENVLGRELKPSEKTHMLGLNSRGSDQISKQILTEKLVDKSGNVVGNSLKDITMKVPKGRLLDFEDYLVNQHAITRMERGEKVFPDSMEMTPDKSKAIVKNYEATHPEFKEIAKEYYEYNKQLGQKWLVDTGILSKDQWEGYLKANPKYVPNNRIFSDIERPLFYGSKKGFANQTNPVKKAVGSQRKIVSPIESTIEHTAQYIKTAKRNEVMQTLINNIKQNPEAFKDWAEIVPTEKTPSSIMETLQKEGVDGFLENLNKGFDQKPDLTKGNIIRGLIEGKPVHVKVHDPELLDALTNLQPNAQNVVMHAIGQVTRVMKNLTTGINPVFSLTRNIWRDIPTAFVNSKSTNNPLTFSKDLVQSVVSVMKNDELYRSFKAVGGGHSSPISSDVNLLAQSKRSILPKEKGALSSVKHYGGKALGALENLNNAVEAAPRLAEFKRFAKKGDYDSVMKGLYEANDVTVNFNKRGNVTKEFDALIPYLNAAVQGLDKTWRVLASKNASKSEKLIAGLKAFTAVTIPSIALYTINHDNPNYKKLSNYIKDSNFLIPNGNGTFTKIPKSRELGVLFGSDVERLLRKWADDDPAAFKDFGTYIKEMFSLPTRTIAAPFSDIRSNKNFMGAPIVSGDLQGLTPKYQYDSQTSEVSKKIGNLTNISPKQLDYLISSYTGIIGDIGIPATNKNTSIAETLKKQVTADPVFSNDIQRDFYDTKTKLDQAHNDLAKQGVKSENLNENLRKIFNKKSLEMGKIRKKMKEAQKDNSLSTAERLKQLRELQEQINRIAESGNELVR